MLEFNIISQNIIIPRRIVYLNGFMWIKNTLQYIPRFIIRDTWKLAPVLEMLVKSVINEEFIAVKKITHVVSEKVIIIIAKQYSTIN